MSTAYNRDAFADLMGQLALQAQEGSTTFTGGGFGKSNVGMQGVGRPMSQGSAIQEFKKLPSDVQKNYVNQITDPNARMAAANTLGVTASFNSDLNPGDFRFYDPNTFSSETQNPFSTISDRQLNILGGNDFFQNLYDAGGFFEGVPNAGTGVGSVLNFDALGGNDPLVGNNVEQVQVTGTRGTDPISAIGAGGFNITPDLNLGGDGGDDEQRQPDADPSTFEELLATTKKGVLAGANTVIPSLPFLTAGYDFIKELPEGDFKPEELDTLKKASDAANVFVDSQATFPEGGTGTTAASGGVNVPGLGIGSLGGSRGFVGTQDVRVPATGQMGDIYSIRQGDTRGRFAAPEYVNPYADVAAQDTAFRPGFVSAPFPGGEMRTQPVRAEDYVDSGTRITDQGTTAGTTAGTTGTAATDFYTGRDTNNTGQTLTVGGNTTPQSILDSINAEDGFSREEQQNIANLLGSGDIGIGNVTKQFGVESGDVLEGLLRGGFQTPTQLTEMIQGYGNEGFQEKDLIADLLNQGRTTPEEVAGYYSANNPEFVDLTPQAVTGYLNEINTQRMQNLSDEEVGQYILSGELTPAQAANMYQSRYPGLTEADVTASLNQMQSQGVFDPPDPGVQVMANSGVQVMANGGVAEKADGIESLLDKRQQAVNRMLSKRAVAQFRDGGAVVKKPLAPANFAGGGIATKLIQKGADMLGFDDARQIEITREAVDLTNQMVNAGLVDPQFRVKLRMPTSGEQSTRQNTGIEGDEEVFNAVNHALFSYHAGKSPLARAGSQAKEIYQGIRLAGAGKDPGSESLDYFNNMFGFDLARQGLSPEEAKNAIIDNIANINNQGAMSRLQAGEPLVAGKDLSRTAEDIRGSGPDVSAFDVLAGVQGLKDGGPPEKVPASFLEGRGNFYGTSNERPRVDTGEQNLTLQKRLDQATPLEQYAFEVLGLEPGLDRAMLLPEADRRSGSQELAVPGLAYDTLKVMLAPAAALKGKQITPEETIELAMETMGTGAAMPGVDIGTDFMAGMAAKPKGGVYMPMSKKENPLGPDFEDTGMPSYFRDSGAETIPAFYADQLISSGMDEGLAMSLAGRIQNYFKKSYGTGSDPLRTQMLEGKIDPIFTENITPELLKQARDDYAASKKGASRTTPALEKFEEAYDRATGIIAEADSRDSIDYRLGLIKREQERMTQEGVPQELQNQTYIMPAYPEEYAEAALDNPAIARALAESEPIYEIDPYRISKDGLRFILPEEMVDGIMSLPANKLENMSVPDIVANVQKTGVAKDVREVRDFSKDFKKETRAIKEASLEEIPPENIFNRTLPDSKFLLEKGVKKVDDFDNEGWFRITEPAYTELEGALMDHSVGGYSESGNYSLGGRKALASGRAGIFSLRNNKTGRPRLTVEIDFIDPDRPKPTSEIRGPSNSVIKARDYDKLFSLYDEVGVFDEDVPSFLQDAYRRYKEMGVSGMDDDYFV